MLIGATTQTKKLNYQEDEAMPCTRGHPKMKLLIPFFRLVVIPRIFESVLEVFFGDVRDRVGFSFFQRSAKSELRLNGVPHGISGCPLTDLRYVRTCSDTKKKTTEKNASLVVFFPSSFQERRTLRDADPSFIRAQDIWRNFSKKTSVLIYTRKLYRCTGRVSVGGKKNQRKKEGSPCLPRFSARSFFRPQSQVDKSLFACPLFLWVQHDVREEKKKKMTKIKKGTLSYGCVYSPYLHIHKRTDCSVSSLRRSHSEREEKTTGRQKERQRIGKFVWTP